MRLVLILFCWSALSVSQGTAQLADSLWIYFEDGKGHKDSILFGGRDVDTIDPDPAYKELPYRILDSVFEVTLPLFDPGLRPRVEDAFFKKGSVTLIEFDGFGNKGGFFVRIKYPPLKIYYDQEFFRRDVNEGAWISPDMTVGILFSHDHDEINRYECLRRDPEDTITFFLGTEYMNLDLDPLYRLADLNNGERDSIWYVVMSEFNRPAHWAGGPCPLVSHTSDSHNEQKLLLSNLSYGTLRFVDDTQSLKDTYDKWIIYSISGHPMCQGGFQSNVIDVLSIPPGVYTLTVQKKNGQMITEIFVKVN